MVKTLNGCLSDLATKAQYPEFVPLDIAAQDKMAAVHLQKHPLKGIRIGSKIKRGNTISRYPINDLKNFATLSDPANAQKMAYEAIMNYRQELGSNNIPSGNFDIGYSNRVNGNYIPRPPTRIDNDAGGVQVGATLSLGRLESEPTKLGEEERVLADLNKRFRDDSDKLALIEAQFHQTGANEILNIPM